MQSVHLKKNWIISESAFNRLLDWLDDGIPSGGTAYLEMSQRLAGLFDRKNCPNPHELADETLNRVARRLEEEGEIECETPAKYCYIVAKFVFMESLRNKENHNIAIDEVVENKLSIEESVDKLLLESHMNCLEKCTNNLENANREIILGYYYGEQSIKIQNRRNLAGELGITVNALSIRACRIREKLQICMEKCLEK